MTARNISRFRRYLRGLVILLGGSYLVCVAGLLINQRNFIYQPRARDQRTPADYKLTYQEVNIPVAGDQVSAWWLAQPDSEKAVSLIYCHGNSASLSNLAHESALLFGFGWNVLIFDYRGYGNSQAPQSGISEQTIAADANAAYDWLIKQNIDTNKVIVWGHSLGSAVAARLSFERKPRALVLEGTFPGILPMARYRYPWAFFPRAFVLDKFDVASYTEKSNVPKFFIHGTDDRIVPWQMGREVYEKAAGNKEFLSLEELGHNDFPKVEHLHHQRILQWVTKQTE